MTAHNTRKRVIKDGMYGEVSLLGGEAVSKEYYVSCSDVMAPERAMIRLWFEHVTRMCHPRIVRVLDYAPKNPGLSTKRPTIIMPRIGSDVRSNNLSCVFSSLGIDEKINAMVQAYEAVSFLHASGFLHYDLSLSSFLVDDSKDVYLYGVRPLLLFFFLVK